MSIVDDMDAEDFGKALDEERGAPASGHEPRSKFVKKRLDFDGPGDVVEFQNVECFKATEKALIVRFVEGSTQVIPKSQVRGGSVHGVGDRGTLKVNKWVVDGWKNGGGKRQEELVTIGSVACTVETPKALIVEIEGEGRTRAIPKSQIRGGGVKTKGDHGSIIVTKWIADQWAKEDAEPPAPPVKVAGVVGLRNTEHALLAQLPDGREVWLPLDGLDKSSEVTCDGDSGTLVVSARLAKQKGIV